MAALFLVYGFGSSKPMGSLLLPPASLRDAMSACCSCASW
jgi:hypothetical protein